MTNVISGKDLSLLEYPIKLQNVREFVIIICHCCL